MTTTIATPTYTIECPICGAVTTGAPAKYIHRCDVRGERGKLLSREFVAYYEGRPVNYAPTATEAQRELDAYVYDLLARTAAETADIEAAASAEASTEAPLLVDPAAGCEICAAALVEWQVRDSGQIFDVCEACYIRVWRDNDDAVTAWEADQIDPPTGPEGDPESWPDAAPQLGRRDHVVCKRVCILCDGDHPAELCPRIRLGPLTCGACGDGNHHIQQCPAVRAELFAPQLLTRQVAA